MEELRGPHQVVIQRDVPMTARDGAHMLADVYAPSGGTNLPTLLRRTPYGKDLNDLAEEFSEADYFASHGYLVVVQNTRGRFGSTGQWYPFAYEARDGYDAVEWAAALPQSNGRVGMFGQSYGAISQYLTASQRPPSLFTCIPVSAYMLAYENWWYNRGALELNWTLSYFANMAASSLQEIGDTARLEALNALKANPDERFSPLREEALRILPLTDWIETFGEGASFLADVLHHETDNPYWSGTDIRRQFFNIDVPMLHVGSWYDIANWDTPQLYHGVQGEGLSKHTRDHQALLIGPWGHLLPFNQPTSAGAGDIDFGPEAAISMVEIERQWFDHFVRDEAIGLPRPPVTLFVMGDNVWRDELAWPLDRAKETTYYLSSNGSAQTMSGDGRLALDQATVHTAADTYRYDPADPVQSLGGRYVGGGVADQRPKADRTDVLFYTSEPVDQRLEITGAVRLELFVQTDAPDTDFIAILCDVHPDGFVQNLAEGLIRLRYRGGFDHVEPVTPGELLTVQIDLGNLSHAILPGHALQLMVTSSDFPRWDRNLNTGEKVSTGTKMVVATQTVYHDSVRPSRLLLPTVDE